MKSPNVNCIPCTFDSAATLEAWVTFVDDVVEQL